LARKILLADDSVTAQNMGRKILADAGYEVIAVNNGSAALKKIAELKPELAILDVYMPGYSGLEVCQRLKESQDGARIPVLLSVGKLEPFKPEEATRVRAEGYIVKPFEASELLSALAKLEDKIVPRAEASRQGRFARAIAAVEESEKETKTADEAGKREKRNNSRQRKNDSEANFADEAAIYNLVNRDLRTGVETPAERRSANGEQNKEEQSREAAQGAEPSFDVAALAPAGFPKDVTPEEVAAIAAAAAQIKLAAAIEEEHRSAEAPVSGEPVSETAVSDVASSPALGLVRDQDLQSEPVSMAGAIEPSSAASSGESRWTAVSVALDSDEAAVSLEQEMQKAYGFSTASPEAVPAAEWRPVSSEDVMAHTEASGDQPSPKAEPVLDEPIIAAAELATTPVSSYESLSQIAPGISSDTRSDISSEIGPEAAQSSSEYSRTDSVADALVPSDAASTAHSPVSTECVAAEASSVPDTFSVLNVESAREFGGQAAPDAAFPSAVSGESHSAAVQPYKEPTPTVEFGEVAKQYPAAQSEAPAVDAPVERENQPEPVVEAAIVESVLAEPAVAEAMIAEAMPAEPVIAEPPLAEPVAGSSSAFAPMVRDAEPAPTPELDSESTDSESVKSTAAAWASWRQIRDSSETSETTPAQAVEVGAGEADSEAVQPTQEEQTPAAEAAPLLETSAMAVAAGAEQTPQEASSTPSNGDSLEVASIVDSLLADLRPKLMEEIARKMAQKK
jgi:CheY-like chemotaxis protein